MNLRAEDLMTQRRLLPLIGLAFIFACGDGELRGHSEPSPDGRSYLVIEDDNRGACRKLLVDGATWTHPRGTAGEISPGEHTIKCGEGDSGIGFSVRPATTFYFDYWGP